MAVGRRGSLRVLGLSPLAAKAAADNAIAEVTGMSRLGAVGLDGPNATPPSWSQAGTARARHRNVRHFFRQFASLPAWEIDQIRRETGVFGLDPDIAALRSFSMSAKALMQRERNVARRVAQAQDAGLYDSLREEFREKHGFWFWY